MHVSIAKQVDKHKQNPKANRRVNVYSLYGSSYNILPTVNLPKHAVTIVSSNILLPKYIGPCLVLRCLGNAYMIEQPSKVRKHPILYVGLLRLYVEYAVSFNDRDSRQAQPFRSIDDHKLTLQPHSERYDILMSW